MSDLSSSSTPRMRWLRWALMLAASGLIAWQFLTFMDVVQQHTAQARRISQSATWAGQPVGTMPQRHEAAKSGHAQASGSGLMEASFQSVGATWKD